MADFGCCSHAHAPCAHAVVTRRVFLAAAGALGGAALAGPARPSPVRRTLVVQPVFVYEPKERREAASWRWSAEIYAEREARDEEARIQRELSEMAPLASFPLEVLPLVSVKNESEAQRVAGGKHDVMVMYASARNRKVLEILAAPDKWSLIFVRHRSGRIYYMYIGVHPHFLRKTRDEFGQPGMGVDDVVVDSHAELLWRLNSLYALKNTMGKRIVAVGSAGGWGAGGAGAPDRARKTWKLDIPAVPYSDLEVRIRRAREQADLMRRCENDAAEYLRGKGVSLETRKEFVTGAFLLREVFLDLLREAQTDAITVGGCMHTIIPISRTTACLTLTLLNDEGYLAFCESDFVVIPAGILLHYISGKPVFFCNASFPHDGIVTVSHCTAPRRMDGRNLEPARLLTHYESDYGAAPKVQMRKGQAVTVLNPDFAGRRWLGFAGRIENAPFYPICRTQLEIAVNADTRRLAGELRGFHWMVSYGEYLRETGYALNKAGVDWLTL
jgi:hypothetical protein